MRIALAQINPTVGDVAGNTRRIVDAINHARAEKAEVVLVPEMAVLGYPPRDLLLREHVIRACEEAVGEIARATEGMLAIIGSPRQVANSTGRGIANSAAICRNGHIESWYDKRLLPTYDVFDEYRYFDPGDKPCVIEHHGQLFGITICEDLWNDDGLTARRLYAEDTVADLIEFGADVILNISASPFVMGKPAFRRKLFGRIANRAKVPLIACNQVGGNDDLIFDGHSMVVASDGGVIAEAKGFEEQVLVVEWPTAARVECVADDLAEVFGALVLGVRDYVEKCRFKRVILGLSGGIDSALTAIIATAALGTEQVSGYAMPSRYSSDHSVSDARDLAERLGIAFDVIPIETAHEALENMLAPSFAQVDTPAGVAEENIQARLRGNILMAISNKSGALLLTTGNKSEIAVGYCTLYGDMAGGLAVISDVPKTLVYELSRWVNANHARVGFKAPPIPENTITKPPSAELKPDQTDQDTLPPYEVLDEIVERYVEQAQSRDSIIEETKFDAETVGFICRLVDRNEYKRRQMPTGLKVTGRAFGSGWRMPIAARGI